MEKWFEPVTLGDATLVNRFVFPPIKTAFGTPTGEVTPRHLRYYRQIAENGPAVVTLEPTAVTADGREHPKQLCIHLPESAAELRKIVDVVHEENRLVCLHLNHAGAAANPKVTGTAPKAPSVLTCPTTGQTAEPLSGEEIHRIVEGYRSAAEKAVSAGLDMIEIQGGHGYLLSQFINAKINHRSDRYGDNRLLFAEEVFSAVRAGAPGLPLLLRISGNEMSPEFGVGPEDVDALIRLAEKSGIAALHVGMGSACFSPPWYFHHGRLPEQPQWDALTRLRGQTHLPIIAAGRMGRRERVRRLEEEGLADLIALGRPLLADPDLVEKWRKEAFESVRKCGYCLQGCLHRVKNGQPIGCNINPEVGEPEMEKTERPMEVLVAGGGPAGMSAALFLKRRGHRVTLMEKEKRLGGQFQLAWQAPGKLAMQDGLEHLSTSVQSSCDAVLLGKTVDADAVREIGPELLVWAVGAEPNRPATAGMDSQNVMTAVEYFRGIPKVKGPRILVIGAGRTGLEIAEKLGAEGFEVTATKRTDPIGSMMEMITKKLALKRIDEMPNVRLMPHTAVQAFTEAGVEVETDGEKILLQPFQTVILASGMIPCPAPDPEIEAAATTVVRIGDAETVADIHSAVHAGYELALQY
jgi:2,4-dienoyl-CoA reductase-like NADH-dependent reductase (Old Yellow Enzyme family)/thioredoxin reductase